MALYSKHRIDITAATDSNAYAQKIFERTGSINEVSRTDLTSSFQGTITVTATKSKTFTLTQSDLNVIRMIYIESDNPVTVSLLDNTGTANELTTLALAGPSGAGSCKMFAEIAGFTVAADDTLVFTAGSSAAVVTFALFGDTSTES